MKKWFQQNDFYLIFMWVNTRFRVPFGPNHVFDQAEQLFSFLVTTLLTDRTFHPKTHDNTVIFSLF